MPHFNLPELAIVLVIVVVLFGAGRVSKVGGELGTAIREFRKGLAGEDEVKPVEPVQPTEPSQLPPTNTR